MSLCGREDSEKVLIEATSFEDAKVQACRLAFKMRRKGMHVISVTLTETPASRIDVDGEVRCPESSVILEWSLNGNKTLDSVLSVAQNNALALSVG